MPIYKSGGENRERRMAINIETDYRNERGLTLGTLREPSAAVRRI